MASATTRASFTFSLSSSPSLKQPSSPKPKTHLTFPPFHLKSHPISSFYRYPKPQFNLLPKSIDVSKEDQPISEQPISETPTSETEQEEEKFDKRRLEEKFAVLNTGIYECRSCGYTYNEAVGDPSYPIPPGLPFNKLPEDWRCATCGAAKSFFDSKSVEIAGFAQNQQYGLGEESQLKILRVILVLFEAASGLKINWRKSHIFPINEVDGMLSLTGILGGEVGQLPSTYLGMPLGANSKSNEVWGGVVERCERRLSRWEAQYLSRGGRPKYVNLHESRETHAFLFQVYMIVLVLMLTEITETKLLRHLDVNVFSFGN